MKWPVSPRSPYFPLAFTVVGGVVLVSAMALAARLGGFWAGIASGVVLVLLAYIPTRRLERQIKRRAGGQPDHEKG